MLKINFDKNYNNKLNCDYFTTIRLYELEKVKKWGRYFGSSKTVEVTLNKKHFCFAVIERMDIMTLNQIMQNEFLFSCDTGLDIYSTDTLLKKIYSKKKKWNKVFEYDTLFVILLLKKSDF
jgi:hypothetical protein